MNINHVNSQTLCRSVAMFSKNKLFIVNVIILFIITISQYEMTYYIPSQLCQMDFYVNRLKKIVGKFFFTQHVITDCIL